jgi:acetate kinase
MGFTPVDGLLMGTRCGEVDPGALTYIADKEHMTGNEVWGMINKQAGVLGITGLSSDMRDIENAAAEGNERAKLALDVYYYRVKKYVGAYAAAMGGLDLVVFTGGVGENDPALREYVCSGMEFLGLEFDADVNRGLRGKDTILTKPASRVKAALIATNEELVIATDTFDIVEKLR